MPFLVFFKNKGRRQQKKQQQQPTIILRRSPRIISSPPSPSPTTITATTSIITLSPSQSCSDDNNNYSYEDDMNTDNDNLMTLSHSCQKKNRTGNNITVASTSNDNNDDDDDDDDEDDSSSINPMKKKHKIVTRRMIMQQQEEVVNDNNNYNNNNNKLKFQARSNFHGNVRHIGDFDTAKEAVLAKRIVNEYLIQNEKSKKQQKEQKECTSNNDDNKNNDNYDDDILFNEAIQVAIDRVHKQFGKKNSSSSVVQSQNSDDDDNDNNNNNIKSSNNILPVLNLPAGKKKKLPRGVKLTRTTNRFQAIKRYCGVFRHIGTFDTIEDASKAEHITTDYLEKYGNKCTIHDKEEAEIIFENATKVAIDYISKKNGITKPVYVKRHKKVGYFLASNGKYQSRINFYGKHRHIGSFNTPKEAASVYDTVTTYLQEHVKYCTNEKEANNIFNQAREIAGILPIKRHKKVGYFLASNGKYQSRIKFYGKRRHIGSFNTPKEAASVYDTVTTYLQEHVKYCTNEKEANNIFNQAREIAGILPVHKGYSIQRNGKYQAQKRFFGKRRHIGIYNTRKDATFAYEIVSKYLNDHQHVLCINNNNNNEEAEKIFDMAVQRVAYEEKKRKATTTKTITTTRRLRGNSASKIKSETTTMSPNNDNELLQETNNTDNDIITTRSQKKRKASNNNINTRKKKEPKVASKQKPQTHNNTTGNDDDDNDNDLTSNDELPVIPGRKKLPQGVRSISGTGYFQANIHYCGVFRSIGIFDSIEDASKAFDITSNYLKEMDENDYNNDNKCNNNNKEEADVIFEKATKFAIEYISKKNGIKPVYVQRRKKTVKYFLGTNGKFQSWINFYGKRRHIGCFNTPKEAESVYDIIHKYIQDHEKYCNNENDACNIFNKAREIAGMSKHIYKGYKIQRNGKYQVQKSFFGHCRHIGMYDTIEQATFAYETVSNYLHDHQHECINNNIDEANKIFDMAIQQLANEERKRNAAAAAATTTTATATTTTKKLTFNRTNIIKSETVKLPNNDNALVEKISMHNDIMTPRTTRSQKKRKASNNKDINNRIPKQPRISSKKQTKEVYNDTIAKSPRGVRQLYNGRYQAHKRYCGVVRHIGTFDTQEDAAKAFEITTNYLKKINNEYNLDEEEADIIFEKATKVAIDYISKKNGITKPVYVKRHMNKGYNITHNGRYQAQKTFFGKRKQIGIYDTTEEATLAFQIVSTYLQDHQHECINDMKKADKIFNKACQLARDQLLDQDLKKVGRMK